jgi:hypothetical protein
MLLATRYTKLTCCVVAGKSGGEGLVPAVPTQLRVEPLALLLQSVDAPLVVHEQQGPEQQKFCNINFKKVIPCTKISS